MYTTVEALKDFAGFDDLEDALLNAMILSATGIIENFTGRKFDADESTERYFTRNYNILDRFDRNKLYLDEDLAEEASHITDSPTVVYLPENDPPYHSIVITDGAWHSEEVIINGYWGYSKTPPDDIQMACLRLSKWLYDMGEGGGSEAIFTPEGQVLLPSGLPQDVITILKPYKKVVVI